MLDDELYFTVTDLKQFTFCPRVLFYERCLPHIRPRTYKMDAGHDVHEDEPKRAVRRTLYAYEVEGGKRLFDVALSSDLLRLCGKIDEVVQTNTGEYFPVDYKLAHKEGANHQIQVAAYALLMEDAWKIKVQ